MNEFDFKHDPIEDDPKRGPLVEEARTEAEARYRAEGKVLGFGSCHYLWGWQKQILLEEYGIEWRTPAEMNPDVLFD